MGEGTSMIIDRLWEAVENRGPVCLGLDPTPELLPEGFADHYENMAQAYWAFNKAIIDATLDVVACYKVQIAHYEALDLAGLACYRDTLRYIRQHEAIAIGDVKRGDIGSTATCYAQAHFQGAFEADFLTLNPMLGSDAVAPFLQHLEGGEKGAFFLVRTSNPGAQEFQEMVCSGKPLYVHVAERVWTWGERFLGRCGYSSVGAVLGANRQVLSTVRRAFPRMFFLVPGFGAQGAGPQDVAPAFRDRNGAVIVAARSILGAHRAKPDGVRNFADYARHTALAMRAEIQQCLG